MRTFFKIFLIAVLAVAGLLALGVLVAGSSKTLNSVSEALNSARVWLHAAQLSAIAVVWWKSRALLEWAEQRGSIGSPQKNMLLGARHRIMGAVLAFQLVVVMGIPFRNPFAG